MMRASVIISTYDQPRFLELALTGYACQNHDGFEVVVADDGSGPETDEVVRRARGDTGLRIVHVWHEDRGFRKGEIRARIGIEELLAEDHDARGKGTKE